MMDFLRALAPSHATARTRAVAVVPSRFEGERPLGRVAPRVGPGWSVEEGSLAVDVARPQLKDEKPIARLEPADAQDDTIARTERVAPVTARQIGSAPAQAIAQPQSLRIDAARPLRRTSPQDGTPSHSDNHPAEAVRLTQLDSPAPLRSAAVAVRETVLGRGARHLDRGPLSSRVIEARSASSHAELPPVVHVTIDRIDVRAPAAGERTSPRARSRTASSGSLTDYLRSRHDRRPGGGS